LSRHSGGQSLADHDGDGGSGDIATGNDGHEAGGMNEGKAGATATAAGGSGVLINVRFATADMSISTHTHQQKQIYNITASSGESVCKACDR